MIGEDGPDHTLGRVMSSTSGRDLGGLLGNFICKGVFLQIKGTHKQNTKHRRKRKITQPELRFGLEAKYHNLNRRISPKNVYIGF